MKMYGYSELEAPNEQLVPSSLAEITLCATPTELRQIAGFLNSCAAEMERMGSEYDHVHLSDRLKEFEASPHFVVAKAER